MLDIWTPDHSTSFSAGFSSVLVGNDVQALLEGESHSHGLVCSDACRSLIRQKSLIWPSILMGLWQRVESWIVMHWVKERIFEYEMMLPDTVETVHRVHLRLRSDGSMWYQIVTRGGFYDREPAMLEVRFSEFLASEVPVGVHSGWTEKDFDDDFLWRLQQMNGREVIQSESKSERITVQ